MLLVKNVVVLKHGDDDDVNEFGQIIEIGKTYTIDIFCDDAKDAQRNKKLYKDQTRFIGRIIGLDNYCLLIDCSTQFNAQTIGINVLDIEYINLHEPKTKKSKTKRSVVVNE